MTTGHGAPRSPLALACWALENVRGPGRRGARARPDALPRGDTPPAPAPDTPSAFWTPSPPGRTLDGMTQATGHPAPAETLTLSAACAWAGKSRRTLRRWIGAGHLTAIRPPKGGAGPVKIRTAELRAHLATLSAPAIVGGDTMPRAPAPPPDTPSAPALAEAHAALVEVLREQAADLRADRDRWMAEAARLRADRDRWVQAAEEARQAQAAVEAELVERTGTKGIVRGLLGRWAKRRGT